MGSSSASGNLETVQLPAWRATPLHRPLTNDDTPISGRAYHAVLFTQLCIGSSSWRMSKKRLLALVALLLCFLVPIAAALMLMF